MSQHYLLHACTCPSIQYWLQQAILCSLLLSWSQRGFAYLCSWLIKQRLLDQTVLWQERLAFLLYVLVCLPLSLSCCNLPVFICFANENGFVSAHSFIHKVQLLHNRNQQNGFDVDIAFTGIMIASLTSVNRGQK